MGHTQVNPNPPGIPLEVWEAFENFHLTKEATESKKAWDNFLKTKAQYKQDDDYNFLKDETGSFIKVSDAVEKEVPND